MISQGSLEELEAELVSGRDERRAGIATSAVEWSRSGRGGLHSGITGDDRRMNALVKKRRAETCPAPRVAWRPERGRTDRGTEAVDLIEAVHHLALSCTEQISTSTVRK